MQSIILPFVLYGCETWSLTLRKGHKIWVFENRVLHRLFGSRKEEVAWGWRNCTKSFITCMLQQIWFG